MLAIYSQMMVDYLIDDEPEEYIVELVVEDEYYDYLDKLRRLYAEWVVD